MPVVAIAGSRALSSGPHLNVILIRFLAGLSPKTKILLRAGYRTSPGAFEQAVAAMCRSLQLEVEWRPPKPGGRQETWARDIALVEDADLTLVFVTADEVGSETSGTFGLVEKAIQSNRPVYAFSVDVWGFVSRAGEHDPTDQWSSRMPAE